MKIFEGKSPSEKKKLIIAMVLGGLALLTLTYSFGGMFFGGSRKTTVTVNVSPTPTATVSTSGGTQPDRIQTLSQEQINSDWLTRPVIYVPGAFYAPDAGRNIFAFYEPPQPTPYVSVEVVKTEKPTPPPSPPPTPDFILGYVSPQSVYAGSKNFRLEVNGDRFTPDSLIIWNGSQIPSTYVSPQKMTADISAGLISAEGPRTIEVRTPTGKYSNPVQLNVQAPPKPNYQYIGLIARRRSNNDTATLIEANKTGAQPFSMRLNDVIGRFRMVSISEKEVVMEDTTLFFRHKLPMTRPTGGVAGGVTTQPGRGGFDRNTTPGRFPTDGTNVVPYPQTPPAQEIPGIPSNIPRYVPPTPQQQQQKQQKDDEDDEDGDN